MCKKTLAQAAPAQINEFDFICSFEKFFFFMNLNLLIAFNIITWVLSFKLRSDATPIEIMSGPNFNQIVFPKISVLNEIKKYTNGIIQTGLLSFTCKKIKKILIIRITKDDSFGVKESIRKTTRGP